MSTTDNQFRGVTFGGFNRQDVLTYVETTVAEHDRQIEQLKKELDLAEDKCKEQAAALAEAETRETNYKEENNRLSAELDATQNKLTEKSALLADAELALTALREKVKALEPGAQAYARVKDRTASIELEAHLRAQNILDEAEVQAKETRARLEGWLRRVQAVYDRLRTDVDATISHASGELGRVQKSLSSVTADFSGHDDALTNLFRCCQEEIRPKAPEPIPLERK